MFKRIFLAFLAIILVGVSFQSIAYADAKKAEREMKRIEKEKQEIVFDQRAVDYYIVTRDTGRYVKIKLPGNLSYINILRDMAINRRYTIVSESISGIDLFAERIKKISDPNSNYYNIFPGVYFITCSLEVASLIDGDSSITQLVSQFKKTKFPDTQIFGVVIYKLDGAKFIKYVEKIKRVEELILQQ